MYDLPISKTAFIHQSVFVSLFLDHLSVDTQITFNQLIRIKVNLNKFVKDFKHITALNAFDCVCQSDKFDVHN